MAEKLRHWEIGKGRGATQMPPYPDHRTMEMALLEEGSSVLGLRNPRRVLVDGVPAQVAKTIELRKNVARRNKRLLDVGNPLEKE